MKKLITIFFYLSSIPFSFSQDESKQIAKVDSLQKIISSNSHDSLKVSALREWDDLIYMYDAELDLRLNQKIDSICKLNLKKKLTKKSFRFFTKSLAEANNAFGTICQQTGKLQEALKHYEVYLHLSEKINNQRGIASAYSNIGIIKQMLGHYDIATDYYLKSLKIREKINNKMGIAICYGNIATAYKNKEELSLALKYNLLSLAIVEKEDDEYSLSLVLNNVGTIIQDIGDSAINNGNTKMALEKYKMALPYYQRSLEISRKIKDGYGEATALHNLGNIHSDMNDYVKAKMYYKEALEMRENLEDRVGMSSSLYNLAIIYQEEGDYIKALEFSRKSFQLAEESEAMEEASFAAKIMFRSFKYLGKYKEALDIYEYHIRTRDSLMNDANQKSVMRIQFKYDYEKQAATDSIRNAELQKVKDAEIEVQKIKSEKQEDELKNKRIQQIYFFIGISLLLVFLGFVYNRFRVTNRQKKIIELQKTEVEKQKTVVVEAHHQLEEKNKEILDSINYAKRIQQAILPSRYSVSENIKNGFIIYKPKDIVAGDFYWIEKYNNKLFIAAADCTGHGVPGAMVSVVCSNALSKALLEDGITETGKILDRTRELVIEKFSKSEENVQDGMDISLLSFTFRRENESELKMQWSGANNPLWIIRNSELIEYKPNKQPIGKYSDPKPFTTNEIELLNGDTIYIFTDGLQDQFGGERGKKFKAAKFKELLLSIQDQEMLEQKITIENKFEEWRGNIEQNDDVCIIGVKI